MKDTPNEQNSSTRDQSRVDLPYRLRTVVQCWVLTVKIKAREDFRLKCRLVLTAISTRVGLDHKQDNYLRSWPSQARIAELTGLPIHAVKRAIKCLSYSEVIEVQQSGVLND